MTVLTVGNGKEYATIAAAVAAAGSGDTIDVNAGTYAVANLKIAQNLTFVAVGGTVDIVPSGAVSGGLFIAGSSTSTPNITIQGFSFSGAENSVSNGAGIRYQSGNLTLVDDSFSNNQDGILATPYVWRTGTIDVNDSVFNQNGAGNGQSHNIDIGYINTFVMTNSVSENAKLGDEVMSQAENNTIEDNQILDGPTGTASYSIDLANDGNDIVQGNTITKGPDASTPIAIYVGGPMLPYVASNIAIRDNTFINDYGTAAQVVYNEFTVPVAVTNNTIKNFNTILNGIGTQSGNVNASGGTIAASTSTTPPDAPSYTINLSKTSGNQTVTLNQSNQLVIGGSGLLTAILDASPDTVYGGLGGVAVSGDGGQTVYTKAGSTNTIQASGGGNTYFSFGKDTITVSGANSNYDIYGTAEVNGEITAGGNEASYVSGTENFDMRGGNESFSIFPGGTENISGTGNVSVSEHEATVNFGYTNALTSGVSSGSLSGGQVVMNNSNITVYEDTTRAKIDLVKGANTYDITDDAGSTISGGGANVDVFEWGSSNLTFIGGFGSAIVDTGSGSATVFAGSGKLLVNEDGNVVGDGGPINYNFNDAIGGGTVTIYDFDPSADTFTYSGFTGNPIASQTVSGGSLYVTLQNHTTIAMMHETKL